MMHGCSLGSPVRGTPGLMKNFARLVRFALPYKVRFGLSICCAAMVALLFFAELGAVYPLLHILFDEPESPALDREEDRVDRGRDPRPGGSQGGSGARAGCRRVGAARFRGTPDKRSATSIAIRPTSEVRSRPWRANWATMPGEPGDASVKEQDARLENLRRVQLEKLHSDHRLAYARWKELADCGSMLSKGDPAALSRRVVDLEEEIKNQDKWLWRWQFIQPSINRYLPKDSFKSLVLLIGIVMLGVAFKGVFLFLQEVLVADVMQLTLFHIRNDFFRSTVNLDLASFSDQGSSELMARFTNDMDSFGQGLNTLMSKVIREPMRIVACLGGALLFNWRLTC